VGYDHIVWFQCPRLHSIGRKKRRGHSALIPGGAQGIYSISTTTDDPRTRLIKLRRPRDLELYSPSARSARGRTSTTASAGKHERYFSGKVRGPMRARLTTRTLTADVTVTPDFAQWVGRPQGINLTPFLSSSPKSARFVPLGIEQPVRFRDARAAMHFLFLRRRPRQTRARRVRYLAGDRLRAPWVLENCRLRRYGCADDRPTPTAPSSGSNANLFRIFLNKIHRARWAIAHWRAGQGHGGVASARAGRLTVGRVDRPTRRATGKNWEPKVWIAGSQRAGVACTLLSLGGISTDYPNVFSTIFRLALN